MRQSYASVRSRVNTGARASPSAAPKRRPGSNIEEAIQAIRMRIQQLSMPGARASAVNSPQRHSNSQGRSSALRNSLALNSPYGNPKASIVTSIGSYPGSNMSSPTVPSSGGSGWGRSATVSKFSDSPVQLPGGGRQFDSPPAQYSTGGGSGGSGSGWGRTALLSGGSSGGGHQVSPSWDKSAPLQTSAPDVNKLISDMFSQPVSVRGGAPVSVEPSPRHMSAPRPFGRSSVTPPHPGAAGQGASRIPHLSRGRSPGGGAAGLDKGSMIYVLGATSNSVKAKQMANRSFGGMI